MTGSAHSQTAQLIRPCLLALVLGGCALEWERPLRDTGRDASQQPSDKPHTTPGGPVDAGPRADAGAGHTLDAHVSPPDAAGDVETSGCSVETCEHGTCNAGGCDCDDPNYPFDGVRCAPPLCTGVPCPSGERCEVVDGETTCDCAPGYTRCGESCVDTQENRDHCGECDFACAPGLGCASGECEQRVHAMALDEAATCALLEIRSSGTAYPLRCWGRGDFALYRLADPAEAPTFSVPTAVVDVPAAAMITMSPHRRCIVEPNSRQVTCWGRCGKDCDPNHFNTTGYESLRNLGSWPVNILSTADGWDGFQGVGGNTCVLKRDGDLACAGYAVFTASALGHLGFDEIRVETFATSPKFIDVHGTTMQTCGVIEDGRVACWGDPDSVMLGAESHCPDYEPGGTTCTDEQAVAVLVQREGGGDLTGVVSARTGGLNSCAVTRDHKVYCWGTNGITGVLGANRADPEDFPQGAVEIAAKDEFVEVAVGGTFSCARTASGQVYCWGSRDNVGLGDVDGDTYEGRFFKSPRLVPALAKTHKLWAGHAHACAQMRSGEVLCWGKNENGQLGTGDTEKRLLPTAVLGLD